MRLIRSIGMRVGYVGLGAMGRELARHLLSGPYELIVRDLDPSAAAALVADGAKAAGSLAELSGCDVVFLCLPKSSHVEQALFGDGGLAASLAAGSIVVDQTSGVPKRTADFARRLAERGIGMIDAPVAGGVPSAIAGQITVMASGPTDEFERIRPILATMSPKLFHCGDRVGAGQALKAVNNLVNTGLRMATLELLGLARRMGHSVEAVSEALNASEARSFVTQRLLPSIIAGTGSADFALALMVKDVNQAADLGIASGVPMPVSDAARSLMNTALNLLGGESRLDDLIPFMERATGAGQSVGTGAVAQATGSGPDTLWWIDVGLAAANRVITIENVALAEAAGLKREAFAPVIEAGSGSSVQAGHLFADRPGIPDQEAIAALDHLSRAAADLGVPLTMIGQVRAHYLARRAGAHGSPSGAMP